MPLKDDTMSGHQVQGSATGLGRPLNVVAVLVAVLAIGSVAVWRLSQQPAPGPSTPPATQIADETQTPDETPAPTGAPTTAPSAGESPSTGFVVEANIVDRPGVPQALYDKYWFSLNQVGQVGTTARLVLPANEGLVGVDAGRVASVLRDQETFEPVIGPNGATILVRDIRTGETVRTVETGVYYGHGLLVGNDLWWTGKTLPIDSPDSHDAGVSVIDVSDPTSTAVVAVEPSDLSAEYGAHSARSLLWLSDHGRSVLSTVVGESTKATQVFDVASRSIRTTLGGMTAYQIVDRVALVGTAEGVRLVIIESGDALGPTLKAEVNFWSVVGDSEIYVPVSQDGKYKIAAINIGTGASHIVRVRGDDILVLDRQLSAPSTLALVPDEDPSLNSEGKVQIPVSLLDPATGDLISEAFTIGKP